MIELCNSLAVLSSVLLDLDNETKIIYHKRSDNVGVNPNKFSSIPNGNVDNNHNSLVECVEEEFREELLGDNQSLVDELNFSTYYTDICVPIDSCAFQVISSIYLDGKDATKFLENFEKSKESEEIFIEPLEDVKSKIGDEINIYNSSLGGYYCIKRNLECYEEIRKIEN